MKKPLILPLILFIIALFSCAHAYGLTVEPYAGGFLYGFQADEEFLVLQYQTDTESARCTVFTEDGNFAGEIALCIPSRSRP